jgi:uncharacterized Ntn-hydrolase superfamily protein
VTFSIAARCARTGEIGMAVSSSSPAVAARCAHARAGTGAVATQNITDPTLGPAGLDFLASGLPARAALARLMSLARHPEYRQLVVVDSAGGTATFSGARTLGVQATVEGPGAAAAGNLLASPDVPAAMLAACLAAPDLPLGARLVAAMQAGLAAGGEMGPVHSAGLLVVRDVAWPVADLRVDWHETDPIAALADLWALWEPQMDAYVARALDPASAPSYGVPGDPGR